MRRSRFFKYLPTSETIRNSRVLRPFGRHLQHHFLWQFNRQSVAGGAAVGMFFGILMPFAQTLFAALCAIVLRVNLPVAALATVVSNPLTFAPMYYLAYRMGNLLLAGTPLDDGIGVRESKEQELERRVGVLLEQQVEVSGWWDNLTAWAVSVGPALALGLLVLALVSAAITYLTISGFWRLQALRRWRRRPGYQPYRLSSLEARFILPRQLALAMGLVGFLLVAAVDVSTSARISLLPLHLIPTLFVAWFVGARWGMIFAVAMAGVQVLIALRAGLSRDLYWQLDLGGDLLVVLFLIGMQARLRHRFEELIRVAKHDNQTGTLNRSGFYAALDMEIERCRRYGHPFALIYFDCDNFKEVNDKLGHRTGDRLLSRVARILRDKVRKIDAVGRLGGDEFAILLSETDMETARRTALQVKEEMDALMKKEIWPVSFSIGVAGFAQAPASVDAAIESVDRLMYQVKHSSKDDVAFASY